MTTDQTAAQQSRVDAFNRAHPIGYPVRYWTGEREGDGKISTTRTAAQILSGHTAVVWVEGEASCIALTHVEPLPDQPADACGEVGTSFTTDYEPHYTDPCRLPAAHDEPHDWAQREAAGEPSPAETAERLATALRGTFTTEHLTQLHDDAANEQDSVTHVEPLPDQPDGIEDDSRDLPDPARAAERIREYICASGDGLYDIQDGAPLYARDLEAVTRAVLENSKVDGAFAEGGATR